MRTVDQMLAERYPPPADAAEQDLSRFGDQTPYPPDYNDNAEEGWEQLEAYRAARAATEQSAA